MDAELRALLDRLDRRLAVGDTLSASFARELAAVWRDAERALRQLVASSARGDVGTGIEAQRGAILLDRVRRILSDAGYDRLVTAAMSESADALIGSVLQGRTAAFASSYVQSTASTINGLREIATVDLFQQGDVTAAALWRSLVQHLFTTRPVNEILQDLADALDEDLFRVRNLFDTQLSIFGRQIEDLATQDLGAEQPFLYAGPIDDVTRPWCLERVGKVFTRAEIETMDNGQLPNPMLTGGGYSCRHSFLAVESQALKDLAGTDERIEPVASDVERIRARKAARSAEIAAKRKRAA